jgi:hypothetical protein
MRHHHHVEIGSGESAPPAQARHALHLDVLHYQDTFVNGEPGSRVHDRAAG